MSYSRGSFVSQFGTNGILCFSKLDCKMYLGYKSVSKFGPDDEYEEEEVTYVTLDLGPSIGKALLPNTSDYRLAVSISFRSFFFTEKKIF